jgi:hypothetical protein
VEAAGIGGDGKISPSLPVITATSRIQKGTFQQGVLSENRIVNQSFERLNSEPDSICALPCKMRHQRGDAEIGITFFTNEFQRVLKTADANTSRCINIKTALLLEPLNFQKVQNDSRMNESSKHPIGANLRA